MRVQNLKTGETGIVVEKLPTGVHVVRDKKPDQISVFWKNSEYAVL